MNENAGDADVATREPTPTVSNSSQRQQQQQEHVSRVALTSLTQSLATCLETGTVVAQNRDTIALDDGAERGEIFRGTLEPAGSSKRPLTSMNQELFKCEVAF